MKNFRIIPILYLLISLSLIIGCSNSNNQNEKQDKNSEVKTESTLKKQGLEYALKAKGVLGKNLFRAIKANGTVNAISFCNEKAYFLTDSVATDLGVKIKRVSDKNRNSNNKANSKELAYLNSVKELLSKGQKIEPQISKLENIVIGYYPIIANQMCMKCHGNPDTEIEKETLSKIGSLYPEDKATGYLPGELRGVWVIEMNKIRL